MIEFIVGVAIGALVSTGMGSLISNHTHNTSENDDFAERNPDHSVRNRQRTKDGMVDGFYFDTRYLRAGELTHNKYKIMRDPDGYDEAQKKYGEIINKRREAKGLPHCY